MKTIRTSFSSRAGFDAETPVFSVAAGVPVDAALFTAKHMLDTALEALHHGVEDLRPGTSEALIWSALHNLEAASALLRAITPEIEREAYRVSQQEGAAEDAFKALAALYLDLTPSEHETLNVFIECLHGGDAQAAHVDLIRRGLRDVVSEGADEDGEARS